ncbi:MAG: efflux RND transporter periplasmic adaptor subunit [Thermoanaerobaculia bacterium]|nr:efflux RND transporter periplasmic adaptor subunit [Thermoanaerobaculia bacterium]
MRPLSSPRLAPLCLATLALAGCLPNGDDGALVLAGALEARTVEVGSLVGGRVARVAVDEGSEVAAGDLLAELEPDLVDRELDGARGRLAAAEARVAAAAARLAEAEAGPRREAVERARIDWEAAKTDLRRAEALHAEGVVDRASFDRALVREASTRQTFEEAERGTRREALDAARAALAGEQATRDAESAQVAYLERQRQEMRITAPAAGRVEAFDLRPGDLVAPNQPVASLLETGELWVRVYVPEPSLGRVAVGQRVAVTVDSFPGRAFDGRIVEIRHRAEYLPRNVQTLDQRSDQVFAVKVALADAAELRPGMAAFVTVAEAPAPPGAEPSR